MPDALLADPASQITVHEAFTGPKATAPFEGVIGVEGMLTGDGRLIAADSLEWATFPLPLRWAAADFGGHDGAVVVGRIDRIERRDNGDIYAWGVLDLGSKDGREVARLMRGQFLSGVSMDLDSVDSVEGQLSMTGEDGTQITAPNVLVTQEARVRAATIVSIPAFDEARLSLVASLQANPRAARIVIGHAAWELTFATVADELAARTRGRLQLAKTERAARAERLAAAAEALQFSPAARRAREVEVLAAQVEIMTGHAPEPLAAGTETFGYNPLQWRDPANGHWIDMPSIALGNLLDSVNSIDSNPDGSTKEHIAAAQSLAKEADASIKANDLVSAQSQVSQIEDHVDSILSDVQSAAGDPNVQKAVNDLDAVTNANSFETGDSAQVDTGDLEGASFDDPNAPSSADGPSASDLENDTAELPPDDDPQLGLDAAIAALNQSSDARDMKPSELQNGLKQQGFDPKIAAAAVSQYMTPAGGGDFPGPGTPKGVADAPGGDGITPADQAKLTAAGWDEGPQGWVPSDDSGSMITPGANGGVTLTDGDGNEYDQPDVATAIKFHNDNVAQTAAENADGPEDPTAPGGPDYVNPNEPIAPGTDLFSTDMSNSDVTYEVGSDGHLITKSADGDIDYGVPVAEPDAADRLTELGFSPDELQDGEVFEYQDGSDEPAIIVNHGGQLYVGSGALTGTATDKTGADVNKPFNDAQAAPAPEPNSIPAGSSDGPQPNESSTAVTALTRILGGPMGNASSKSQAAKMDELAKNIDAAVASGDLKSAQKDATKLQGMLPTEGVTPEEHPEIVAVQSAMAKVLAMKPSTLNDDGSSTPAALQAAVEAQPESYRQGVGFGRNGFPVSNFVVEPEPGGAGYYLLRPVSSDGSKGDYGHFDSEEEAQAAQKGYLDSQAAWKAWGDSIRSGDAPLPTNQEEDWAKIVQNMQDGMKPRDAVSSVTSGSGGNGEHTLSSDGSAAATAETARPIKKDGEQIQVGDVMTSGSGGPHTVTAVRTDSPSSVQITLDDGSTVNGADKQFLVTPPSTNEPAAEASSGVPSAEVDSNGDPRVDYTKLSDADVIDGLNSARQSDFQGPAEELPALEAEAKKRGIEEGAGIDPATGAANGGAPINDDPSGFKSNAASMSDGALIARARELMLKGGSGSEIDAINAELQKRGLSVNG